MKKISAVLIGIFLVFNSSHTFCQKAIEMAPSVIKPYALSITLYKTTHLIFPYAIISVDRGSKEVLAQKANGVENILQLKAARKDFDETNLTVITADGKLYSFLLRYADNPSVLNLQLGEVDDPNREAFFSSAVQNMALIQREAAQVAIKKRTVHGIKSKRYGIGFWLNGLFIDNDVLYLRISIQNKTNINYDIDQLHFYIKDQKRLKRTAIQELEIKPLYVYRDTSVIKGRSEHSFVFALPKFTIPDQKYLSIQLMEKNGGRHLQLKVHNRTIVKANTLK